MTERYIGKAPPEGEEPKEPTRAQQSAANVLFVLTLDELCKKKAKQELGLENTYRKRDYFKVRRIANPLLELYILRYNHLPLDEFKDKWKGEAGKFERLLDTITPAIEEKKEEIMARAAEISDYERTEITKKALRKMFGVHHREAIMSMKGLNEEERQTQRRKYKRSLRLSVGATALSLPVVGAGVAYETAHPLIDFGPITDWKTLLTVTGFMAVRNLSIKAAARTHRRALDQIHTSLSIGATAAHDTTTNVLPEDEKMMERSMFWATGFPSFVQDLMYLASLLAPGVGPTLYAGRLLGETIVYAAEVAGTEGVLGIRNLKRNVQRRRNERQIGE